MSSPTPAPTNIFYIVDDWNVAAGAGGGSGLPISGDFIAPTNAAALTVAYLVATVHQVGVRLVQKFGSGVGPTFTAVAPGAANIALTAVPSGIQFVGAPG